MSLDEIDFHSLLSGEKKFIEFIGSGIYPAYGAGIEDELAMEGR